MKKYAIFVGILFFSYAIIAIQSGSPAFAQNGVCTAEWMALDLAVERMNTFDESQRLQRTALQEQIERQQIAVGELEYQKNLLDYAEGVCLSNDYDNISVPQNLYDYLRRKVKVGIEDVWSAVCDITFDVYKRNNNEELAAANAELDKLIFDLETLNSNIRGDLQREYDEALANLGNCLRNLPLDEAEPLLVPTPTETAPTDMGQCDTVLSGFDDPESVDLFRLPAGASGLWCITDPGGDGDWLFFYGFDEPITIDLGNSEVQIVSSSLRLRLDGTFERVTGTRFDDAIVGNDEDNVLSGSEGDDILIGGAGDDLLQPEAGNDVVTGGPGNDNASGDDWDAACDVIERGFQFLRFSDERCNYQIRQPASNLTSTPTQLITASPSPNGTATIAATPIPLAAQGRLVAPGVGDICQYPNGVIFDKPEYYAGNSLYAPSLLFGATDIWNVEPGTVATFIVHNLQTDDSPRILRPHSGFDMFSYVDGPGQATASNNKLVFTFGEFKYECTDCDSIDYEELFGGFFVGFYADSWLETEPENVTLTAYCGSEEPEGDPVTVSSLAPQSCPGLLASRMVVGEQGRVTPGASNNLREEPSQSAERVGLIPAGEEFTVLNGPMCAEGYAWWKVNYQDQVGWTVEGNDSEYWLEPVQEGTSADNETETTVDEVPFSMDIPHAGYWTLFITRCNGTVAQYPPTLIFVLQDGRVLSSALETETGAEYYTYVATEPGNYNLDVAGTRYISLVIASGDRILVQRQTSDCMMLGRYELTDILPNVPSDSNVAGNNFSVGDAVLVAGQLDAPSTYLMYPSADFSSRPVAWVRTATELTIIDGPQETRDSTSGVYTLWWKVRMSPRIEGWIPSNWLDHDVFQ